MRFVRIFNTPDDINEFLVSHPAHEIITMCEITKPQRIMDYKNVPGHYILVAFKEP